MHLLIITTILSFVSVGSSHLSNPLIKWLKKPTKSEQVMYKEILSLRRQQSELSIVKDFVTHSKLQRKINKCEATLKVLSDKKSENAFVRNLAITYGTKVLVGAVLLAFVVYFRHTPVYVFPRSYSLYPFGALVSYPVSEPGAVSMHFWLIVSNVVARKVIT